MNQSRCLSIVPVYSAFSCFYAIRSCGIFLRFDQQCFSLTLVVATLAAFVEAKHSWKVGSGYAIPNLT